MNEILKRVFSLRIRRKRRYRLKDGAYVLINASLGRYQIDEIGPGGLSFHYVDNGMRPKDGEYDLKVVTADHTDAVRLAGRTVAENETGELIFHKEKIRRRGIRFESLNPQQKRDLKKFIKKNKI